MKTILVVEDDEQIREMLCAFLQDEGYTVTATCNGLEAVEYVSETRPDLVISDVMMPILDGGNMASIIQAKYGERAAPVLGMTALSKLERANDSKFAAVLHKPLDLPDLLAAIENLIGGPIAEPPA
jgi:CheY-like chemotaxis protein